MPVTRSVRAVPAAAPCPSQGRHCATGVCCKTHGHSPHHKCHGCATAVFDCGVCVMAWGMDGWMVRGLRVRVAAVLHRQLSWVASLCGDATGGDIGCSFLFCGGFATCFIAITVAVIISRGRQEVGKSCVVWSRVRPFVRVTGCPCGGGRVPVPVSPDVPPLVLFGSGATSSRRRRTRRRGGVAPSKLTRRVRQGGSRRDRRTCSPRIRGLGSRSPHLRSRVRGPPRSGCA